MSEAKKDSKVFDVAKPGKTTPSASGKPIIVTNRPVLKDPMVVEVDDTSTDVAGESPASKSPSTLAASGHVTIEPLSEGVKPAAEAAAPAAETATGPPEPKPTNSEDQELEARKQAERVAELDKLAESHKYYLPINQIEKRRNKRYAIAGAILIVLLCVLWVDVALDAGLISIPGIKAPTHFFK